MSALVVVKCTGAIPQFVQPKLEAELFAGQDHLYLRLLPLPAVISRNGHNERDTSTFSRRKYQISRRAAMTGDSPRVKVFTATWPPFNVDIDPMDEVFAHGEGLMEQREGPQCQVPLRKTQQARSRVFYMPSMTWRELSSCNS